MTEIGFYHLTRSTLTQALPRLLGRTLTAGHQELAHLAHHAAAPGTAAGTGGSPLVYPPLAAIADNLGGLNAVRLLSLACMLIATVTLHGITKRLLPGIY